MAALLFGAVESYSQKITWDVDFRSVFDNREGDANITPAQTYFFTQLSPEVGLSLGKAGKVAGGAVWTQPIGSERWKDGKVIPTIYYRYESPHWNLSLGMFPRTHLREELPGFLWNDSLEYFQPNIRGALIQYASDNGFIDFYLDWRQMQTETKREAFNVIIHGQWNEKRGIFFAGAHAMMNHYARQKNAPSNQYVVDNFLVNPYIGVNLSDITPLDSLRIRGGALVTLERNRAYDKWESPAGGWLEIYGKWRFLGLKNTLYAGGKLLPGYARFGSSLYPGEPFYQCGFYNRTDLYAYIFSNKYVDLRASLDFNFTKHNFIFYQCLNLRVYIGAATFPKRKRPL